MILQGGSILGTPRLQGSTSPNVGRLVLPGQGAEAAPVGRGGKEALGVLDVRELHNHRAPPRSAAHGPHCARLPPLMLPLTIY